MRTLADLYAAGGDDRRFAEEFNERLHTGDWILAKEHWTRTVQHIADRAKELDDMTAFEAARRAEDLARTLCQGLMEGGRCWACTQDPGTRGGSGVVRV
ncbi:DUF6313 family protein [Streptomyces sp. NPDC046727]|uniref:DUF6313 family protein n=1 Tax=Streptomyces sp. NPDC046727 TaxID=3155373 RepID=UPI0033D4D787